MNHFEDYFKGIVIIPDEQQSYSLLGFQVADSLSALILHYHIESGYENHQKLVFHRIQQHNSINYNMTDMILPWKHIHGKR